MNINSKVISGSTFSERRKTYNICHAIFEAIKDDYMKNIANNNQIYEFIHGEYPMQNQEGLTIMDTYHIPKNLNRNDQILRIILFKLLGKAEDSNPNDSDLQKIKEILDGAARHTIRMMEEATIKDSNSESLHGKKGTSDNKKRQKKTKYSIGIGYFKNTFKDLIEIDENSNVKFKLNTLEDYLTIARKLLSPPQKKLDNNGNEINKFTLAKELKNGLFMKNILAYSDLKKNKIHNDITTLFKKTINDIFCPILNLNKDKIKSSKFESEYSEIFNLTISIGTPKKEDSVNPTQTNKTKRIRGKFIFCIKSEESIIDKIFRGGKYQTTEDLNDMLRGSIIVKRYEDLIFLLHYFIKQFIKNDNKKFYHSENNGIDLKHNKLRDLVPKDKGILITKNEKRKKYLEALPEGKEPEDGTILEEYTDENLDWIATKFLKGISNKESTDTNSTNSENYIDTKLLIPIKIGDSSTSIELKFLLEEQADTNDKGVSSHKIMRLRQNILKIIGNQKHISPNMIRTKIKSLLDSEPELKKEIQQQINEIHNQTTKIVGKGFSFKKTPEDYVFELITTKDVNDLKEKIGCNVFFDPYLSRRYKNGGLLPNRNIVSKKLSETEKEKKDREINVNEVKKMRKEKSIALINEIKNYEGTDKFRDEEKKKKILRLKNKLKSALSHNIFENIKKYYIALQRECIDGIIKDESD